MRSRTSKLGQPLCANLYDYQTRETNYNDEHTDNECHAYCKMTNIVRNPAQHELGKQ